MLSWLGSRLVKFEFFEFWGFLLGLGEVQGVFGSVEGTYDSLEASKLIFGLVSSAFKKSLLA